MVNRDGRFLRRNQQDDASRWGWTRSLYQGTIYEYHSCTRFFTVLIPSSSFIHQRADLPGVIGLFCLQRHIDSRLHGPRSLVDDPPAILEPIMSLIRTESNDSSGLIMGITL